MNKTTETKLEYFIKPPSCFHGVPIKGTALFHTLQTLFHSSIMARLLESTLLLLFLSLSISNVYSIYFILEEGQSKCFLEEVPKDTLVVGKYRTEEIVQPGTPPPAWGGQGQPVMGIKVCANGAT